METTPKPKSDQNFIAILCGGSGPRLWPLSKSSQPKQFLNILSPNSLLTQTINRALKIVPPKNIYIVTNQKYKQKIKQYIPKVIPSKNLVLEPHKKNTLMAMLYTSLIIDKINPKAVVSFFPSDHYIKNIKNFSKDIKLSFRLAQDLKSIVIFGIKPTNINSSYGYIQIKQKINNHYKVNKFIEKPDTATINRLSKNKTVFWNSGIYTFPIITFFELVNKFQPQYSHNLINKNLSQAYKKCPNLSIDVGISQKTNRILLIPSSFSWSDVGEWKSIHKLLKKNRQQISKLSKDSLFLAVDSKNCLVSGQANKLIGLVGVKNLAIIDTPTGLLICRLKKSYNVRDLVSKIVSSKSTSSYFLDPYERTKTN